jgi:plastocyanin
MRGSGIALTAAVGGILLVPASPLAEAPPTPPKAALETASTTVRAGEPVKLDSSGSTPGSGAIVGHVWDLDGNGSFEKDTGAADKVETRPKSQGKLTVRVRVVDDRGQNGDAQLDLTVTAPPKMENADATPPRSADAPTASGPGAFPAADPAKHAPASAPPKEAQSPANAPKDPHAPAAPADGAQPLAPISTARLSAAPELTPRAALTSRTAVAAAAKSPKATTVKAAASTGVTIKNFRYSPVNASVHTGDTITWTNEDTEPHTATANDHSFDTGTIKKGKSGSHTFSKAGTFSYICTIHPSMKATVTVLGASSGGNGGSGNGSGGSNSAGSNGSSSSSVGSGLPHTGLNIAVVVLIATLMMSSGALFREAARRGD